MQQRQESTYRDTYWNDEAVDERQPRNDNGNKANRCA